MAARAIAVLLVLVAPMCAGCSVKTFAINRVGDAMASGDSAYESDDDIELVGAALPFGLKLTESLLAQSPKHRGLLLTACRGFVLYAYAYVDAHAEIERERDVARAREIRARARRLYLRGLGYGLRALDSLYPGFEERLATDPAGAAAAVGRNARRDVPFLYWTAAALGLAISASRDDPALLARLPEVEALLNRALALDEDWDGGALHAFRIVLAGAGVGAVRDPAAIQAHYARALSLSEGRSAGLFVAYAEAVSIPTQNRQEFRTLLERALAINPDAQPEDRLSTLLIQRRARWLVDRIDALFPTPVVSPGTAR